MARVGWNFYDPDTDETFVFPVNPYQDSGSHAITKAVDWEVSSGDHYDPVAGEHRVSTLISSKGAEPERFAYVGRVYTQQELEDLQFWCAKDYPIELTDDLLRSWLVMVESLDLTRVKSRQYYYKHEYKFTGIVLEEL